MLIAISKTTLQCKHIQVIRHLIFIVKIVLVYIRRAFIYSLSKSHGCPLPEPHRSLLELFWSFPKSHWSPNRPQNFEFIQIILVARPLSKSHGSSFLLYQWLIQPLINVSVEIVFCRSAFTKEKNIYFLQKSIKKESFINHSQNIKQTTNLFIYEFRPRKLNLVLEEWLWFLACFSFT